MVVVLRARRFSRTDRNFLRLSFTGWGGKLSSQTYPFVSISAIPEANPVLFRLTLGIGGERD